MPTPTGGKYGVENIAAVVTFMINGKIIYAIGIPAACAGIAGNLLGAKLVINVAAPSSARSSSWPWCCS